MGQVGQVARLVALAVALTTAGALLWLDPPVDKTPPASTAGTPSIEAAKLTEAWPKARVVSTPAMLADGTPYTPWYHLTAEVSIGTAPTKDDSAERLLLRGPTGVPRELRRLGKDQYPQFLALTADGDFVYWAESTADRAGPSETRLWRVNWRTNARPVSLTADTGNIVFFNSQYDIVVADGRVYWIANSADNSAVGELRSVPAAGGRVTVRRLDGPYALSAWPWLVTVGGPDTPVGLWNLTTNSKLAVPKSVGELVGCSPVWCRAMVGAPDGGVIRIDLMKPDGTERHRVAGASASASISDVALLDRYEVLTQGRQSATIDKVQLLLYDVPARKMTLVAEGVGIVQARGGILWWSTGDNEASDWHALDLRPL